MAIGYRITQTAVFAAPAATHTLLLAIAPAGHGLLLVEWGVSMDGITSAAVPATLDLVVSTQGAVGTPVAVTVTQIRGRSTGGTAPTGGCNYTVEPTTLTVVETLYLPQFMGLMQKQLPLGRELECDSSAGGTLGFKAIGLRITPSAIVNVKAYIEVEAVG